MGGTQQPVQMMTASQFNVSPEDGDVYTRSFDPSERPSFGAETGADGALDRDTTTPRLPGSDDRIHKADIRQASDWAEYKGTQAAHLWRLAHAADEVQFGHAVGH